MGMKDTMLERLVDLIETSSTVRHYDNDANTLALEFFGAEMYGSDIGVDSFGASLAYLGLYFFRFQYESR